MQRSKGGTQGRGVKLKPILPAVKRPPEKGTSDKPLTGRVFYLDIPSKLLSEKFEKDIKDLGGTVEGFLSKEISCLITSKKEAKCAKSLKYSCSLSSPEPAQNTGSSSARAGSRRGGIQEERSNKKPEKDDVSRGKSLLKKVIKEQEILPKNSILANAWNWGVRILHVDDAKIYIEQKKRLGQQAKPAEAASKTVVKQPVKRKAKAQKLKSPFIKVEDSTCQYRPLYLVLPCFRSFQSPPSKPCQSVEKKAATANKATETKQGLNKTWHGQDGANNSHCKMREQKKRGYCECCLQKYDDLEAHLVSQTHTNFSQGPYYQDVDNLISMFDFDFVDWSVYRQEAKSSAMLLPTVTVKWEEKEISDRYLRMSQKISSPVKQTPEAIQRTESEVPLAAAANDGLVNNHIPSPEPMESSICPVQTLGNNASATDSEADPPGMPAFLPVTENSRLPEGETITVCDKDINKKITRSLEHTPQELTLGLLVTAPAIRKCSLEHGDGIPSKRIKLDGSLVSATLCSEPVDADHVTGPKAIDRLPGGLEACVEPVDADHVTSPKAIDHLPEGLEACDEPVDSDHVTSPKAIDCLPGGLEACAEPVDADRVTSPKPVVETIPAGLETACPSNDSDASHHQSPHSSPKLQRKVKQVPRKIRKPEDLPSTPVCKVSVPMEEDFEFSSSRERLLSLFDSSGAESEFCGFSCKSESLPHSVRLENEQPPSRGDFHWCFFSTTSSSAGTFHGF